MEYYHGHLYADRPFWRDLSRLAERLWPGGDLGIQRSTASFYRPFELFGDTSVRRISHGGVPRETLLLTWRCCDLQTSFTVNTPSSPSYCFYTSTYPGQHEPLEESPQLTAQTLQYWYAAPSTRNDMWRSLSKYALWSFKVAVSRHFETSISVGVLCFPMFAF